MQRHDEEVISPERREKVKEIFHAAFQQGDRRIYLNNACAGDEELRQEAESLLTANDNLPDSFLQSAAFALGMKIMADEETQSDEMTSETTHVFEAEISIGMKLDNRYEILGKLDAGGMGEVYKARDLKLDNRLVVIKVLKKKFLNNPWMVKKFGEEIEALSRIQHPNVATVYDKGKLLSGEPYLVMEFVKGATLWKFLKDQDRLLEFSEVAEIMQQIGRGVDAIHQARLIHRDLKPKNIMVYQNPDSGEYEVKVIDFGIVRDLDKSTVIGQSPGTVGYMSPEQLEVKEATSASDIYALGLMAYEMLTGTRPFNSNNPVQLLKLQKEGMKVNPSALRPGLPKAVDQVIRKTLSYQASERYQSAREFGDDLAHALTSTPPPPTPKPIWLRVAAVATIGLMSIAAVMLWLNLSTKTMPAGDIATARPVGIKTDAPAINQSVYKTDFWFPIRKPPQGMVYATIGFTVWRPRPAMARDGEDVARETIDSQEMASERIADTISDGERIYLGIESLTGEFLPDKGGYLYVINREQYADGTFGKERLIFPTLCTYAGNNRVKPGKLIVLPREMDDPSCLPGEKGGPYRIKRGSSPRGLPQIAEVYTIILSPWEFRLPERLSNKAMALPANLVADWEKQYGGRMYRATLRGGVGQTRTKREQAVGSRATIDTAEPLTQNEPLPQSCYRGAVKIGNPAMVTVTLRFKD